MNRKYLLGIALVALTASVSLFFVAGAETPKTKPDQPAATCCGPKGCCCPVSAVKPTDDERLLAQLLATLDETKSPDVVFFVVKILEEMGPRARPAIPAVLRSLERVGLCKDAITRPDEMEDKEDVMAGLLDALLNMSRKKKPPATYVSQERRFRLGTRGEGTACVPCVPLPPPAAPVATYGYGYAAPAVCPPAPAPCPAATAQTPQP
jgi:hypothetical protein